MFTLRDDMIRAAEVLRNEIGDKEQVFMAFIALCYAKKIAIQHGFSFSRNDPQCIDNCVNCIQENEEDSHIVHLILDVLRSERFLGNAEHVALDALMALPNEPNYLGIAITDVSMEYEIVGSANRNHFITPESIAELSRAILNVGEEETFADFGTGTGSVLIELMSLVECVHAYGCDIDGDKATIAKIRAKSFDWDVDVQQADMFHISGVFDKCFSHYPFRVRNHRFREDAIACLRDQGVEFVPKFGSTDWLFNLQLLMRTAENGKAVGIMTRGSAYNGADEQIRGYFIANGWIEAVIALPDRILSPYVNVPTALIVLSRGNERIRLVDASEICNHSHRGASFTSEHINTIKRLLKEDEAGKSLLVAYEDLAAEAFNLNPTRYLTERVVVDNGAPLTELVTQRIMRGLSGQRARIDELKSDTPTKYRYFTLQHIIDGQLETDLPFLQSIDKGWERYCVRNGDLLVSKYGPTFKVAIASITPGEKVLAPDNLHIIRLDERIVDPRYVMVYLQSEQGAAQLRLACVGTAQPNITANGFSEILIPIIPMAEQVEIAEKYDSIQKEIELHKLAIEKARQKMASLLDER